jgi:hypothetical protein
VLSGGQALGQTNLYSENFESYPDGTNTSTEWSIQTTGTPTEFSVQTFSGSKWFEAEQTNGNAWWRTKWIKVTSTCTLTASVQYDEDGTLESDDCITVQYSLNNGTPVQFSSNGQTCNDFSGTVTATQTINVVAGDSVQIIVLIDSDGSGEIQRFDNVTLSGE